MTTFDLLQRMQQHLGEQTRFYTDEELVLNGLNPAQRLLTLARPDLLTARVPLTITPDRPFYDLRLIATRIIPKRLRRVILGTVTDDTPLPSAASGELHDVTRVSVAKLQWHQDWLAKRGMIDHYWTWGTHWFGVYKRPIYEATVTLVFGAVPTPLSVDVPTQVPDLAEVYHPLLSLMGAGCVLAKEAGVEGQRGLARIVEALEGSSGTAQ